MRWWASASYRESLSLCRDMEDRQNAARCLQGLAAIAVAGGDAGRATRLAGAAAALRAAIGVHRSVSRGARFEKTVDAARAALGDAAFSAAWDIGQALTLEEATNEALQIRS